MMFDWKLHFSWLDDGTDLVPCMSGGLFGITKQWWHESGEPGSKSFVAIH